MERPMEWPIERPMEQPMERPMEQPFMHLKNDTAVSNYVMHGADAQFSRGIETEFTEPRRQFGMEEEMDVTNVMDMDFDTELPTEIIDMDLTNVPMHVDEDTDFMSEHLFEKLASIV